MYFLFYLVSLISIKPFYRKDFKKACLAFSHALFSCDYRRDMILYPLFPRLTQDCYKMIISLCCFKVFYLSSLIPVWMWIMKWHLNFIIFGQLGLWIVMRVACKYCVAEIFRIELFLYVRLLLYAYRLIVLWKGFQKGCAINCTYRSAWVFLRKFNCFQKFTWFWVMSLVVWNRKLEGRVLYSVPDTS